MLARQRLANDRRQAEELHAKRERKKQVYKAHVSRRLANPAEEQRLVSKNRHTIPLVSGVHSKGVSNDRANRPLEDPIESSCPILDLSGAAVSLHSCTNRPFCLAITVRARCRPELPVPWLI